MSRVAEKFPSKSVEKRIRIQRGERLVKIKIFVMATPYRCFTCGQIQFIVERENAHPVNCPDESCHGDNIEQCGPQQKISILVKPIAGICTFCGCTETNPCDLGFDACAWFNKQQTCCTRPTCVASYKAQLNIGAIKARR